MNNEEGLLDNSKRMELHTYKNKYEALIFNWAKRMEKETRNLTTYLYLDLLKILKEMKEELGVTDLEELE